MNPAESNSRKERGCIDRTLSLKKKKNDDSHMMQRFISLLGLKIPYLSTSWWLTRNKGSDSENVFVIIS